MGQFCQQNIYWRRLKIKFSHETRITFQISWRAESESGNLWTSKFDLKTTCGGENVWIRKEKVQVQIQKYPDTCERGLKKAPLSLQRTGTREALGKMLIYYCYVTRENGLILSCTSSLVGRWIGRYVGSNCKNVYFERVVRKYKVKQNPHPQYSYLQ